MEIILARHGETTFNEQKKIQDHIAPHLTEKGKQQARGLKENLEKAGYDNFDAVICADATRHRETLSIVYPESEKMSHVSFDARLTERLHTELVGKSKPDVEALIGEEIPGRLSLELYFEGTDQSKLTDKFPENETLEEVSERIASLIADIKGERVLLLGSSIINQYILEYLQHGTVGKQIATDPTTGEQLDFQKNDELRVVLVDDNLKMEELKIIHFNEEK